VSTPTDSRPELVTVIAHMRAKPGKEQDLRDALEALIEPTRQEEGYVNYDLHQGIEDSSLFYLYENWESVDTHETHMNTPHLEDFGSRLDELLNGELTVVRCGGSPEALAAVARHDEGGHNHQRAKVRAFTLRGLTACAITVE